VNGEYSKPQTNLLYFEKGEKIHEGASGFLFGVGFLLATFE
jgi:hypothetical protein